MTEPPAATDAPAESLFMRRMRIATYSAVLLVLAIHLLKELRDILEPLFIALFLGFLLHPIHRWLMKRGISSVFAYVAIGGMVIIAVLGIASLMVANLSDAADMQKLLKYEKRLDDMIQGAHARIPFDVPQPKDRILREINISSEDIVTAAGSTLSRFRASTTWIVLTILYIMFLIAEKVSFPHRLALAFGEQHGERIMSVVGKINLAISQYVAVKTLVSALAGISSYVVLAFFQVELAATWGILIFLLNYIPYLGSLIAVSVPILLSFLQFDEIWKGFVIAGLLIGIQQVIGSWIEPRMAGQRLDVSPLLIVLSLAFWSFMWGIVGAILAVPLLVCVKLILENIAETKPIATLISNQ